MCRPHMASHSEQVRVWIPSRALMPVSWSGTRILTSLIFARPVRAISARLRLAARQTACLAARAAARRLRDPSWHRGAVAAVRLAEALLERRLLVEQDEEMEGREDARGVDEKPTAPEPEGVAEQHRHDAHVHRVAHPSVQTLCNELPRRVDRRERAAPAHGEVAHAPEKDGGAGELERHAEPMERADVVARAKPDRD